ncbi:MAG: PD40 domain-containing protein, partial [Leptospiraceae bacterium]|nr:PD40 domain-containing protein [Leptospiraceae bacterium]
MHAALEPKYRSGASGTHVVLVFDTDTVNAFATPYGIDQIVLFLNNPRSGEFARFDAWVELLFTHEYVHVLSLRHWGADQPTLTFLRILLGFPPNLWSPPGMIEGTPVWEESKSGNGRMEDPLTNMIVRTAVLEDAYPSLAEIMNGSHRWPGYAMPYLYGGRIVGYLAGVYDADAVYDYWMSDSVPFNPNGRLPLNAPLAKLYGEKRERDELEFNQQAEQLRRKGLTAFDRLTRDGYVKRFLYLNDEGDLLYFGSPANYTPGLFRWDAEEAEAVHIRRQLSSNGIAWQGGRQIFSEDYFAFPGFGLRYELYDGDSFFLDRIAEDRSISFPALSSDGDRLFYIEHDNRKRYLRSARFNTDDELVDEITILEVPFTGMMQYTAVAPDNGSIVLLVREGEKGNGNLVLCRRQSETDYDCNTLVHGPGTKVQPRFAPDGNRVYFSSDVDGI